MTNKKELINKSAVNSITIPMIKLAWDEFFTLEPTISRKAYPVTNLSKTDILKTLTVIIVEVDNNKNNNNNNKYLN